MVTSLACVSGILSDGLEPARLHDPGQLSSRLGPLPHLEAQLLNDAVRSGLDLHGADPTPLEVGDGAEAAHLGLLKRELRVGGLGHHLKPLFLDLEARGQLLDMLARTASVVGGDQLLGRKRVGGIRIPFGVEIGRTGRRHRRLLVEALAGKVGSQVHAVRLCHRELPLRLEGLKLHVGVAELEQHGLGLHRLSRLGQTLLDPSRGDGGDVPDALGDERAGATHLDDQGPLLHRIDPDGDRSTLGAAGLRLRRPRVASTIATRPRAP